MFKAILFDLDGTLIDTPGLIMGAYEHAINTHTTNTLTKDELTNVLGLTLDIAFQKHANDNEHLNEMIDSFRQYSKENSFIMLKPYENAVNVIQYLRDKNYLVGIVTSKHRVVVDENLEQLSMNGLFDIIITSDDTLVHKPNAEPLLLALNKLGVNPNEAIYIGDHENDIKAGNNALMKTGLMSYSHRFNEAMIQKPTYIFKDLNSIKDIL